MVVRISGGSDRTACKDMQWHIQACRSRPVRATATLEVPHTKGPGLAAVQVTLKDHKGQVACEFVEHKPKIKIISLEISIC